MRSETKIRPRRVPVKPRPRVLFLSAVNRFLLPQTYKHSLYFREAGSTSIHLLAPRQGMEERRYPGGTKRVPDEDDDDGFGAAASQDSLSVCAASVGAFDLRRDDLEKLANGAGKSTPKYDERDRRERIEMLNKRHLLHVTSGRQTRDERNGALSPEEQQRDLEKQDEWEKRGRPELVNKQRATRVTSWRWMEDDRKSANILSPEEEQRADALEKLLHFDVGAKEKIEVERYLAKLRHTDEDIEMFVPEGNKFQFRTPERERGVADGQGDINRSSLSQIRQRFQTRSGRLLTSLQSIK